MSRQCHKAAAAYRPWHEVSKKQIRVCHSVCVTVCVCVLAGFLWQLQAAAAEATCAAIIIMKCSSSALILLSFALLPHACLWHPKAGHTHIHTLCRSVSVSLTGTCHARIVIKCCTLIGVYARFGSRSRSRTCPLSAVKLLAPHPTPSSACYVREQFAEVCVCVEAPLPAARSMWRLLLLALTACATCLSCHC